LGGHVFIGWRKDPGKWRVGGGRLHAANTYEDLYRGERTSRVYQNTYQARSTLTRSTETPMHHVPVWQMHHRQTLDLSCAVQNTGARESRPMQDTGRHKESADPRYRRSGPIGNPVERVVLLGYFVSVAIYPGGGGWELMPMGFFFRGSGRCGIYVLKVGGNRFPDVRHAGVGDEKNSS